MRRSRFTGSTISPLLGVNCRHLPSCSDYAREAIETNGAWKGGWLALSRLCRCHPWGSHGFDPVPDLSDERHPFAPWRYGRWRLTLVTRHQIRLKGAPDNSTISYLRWYAGVRGDDMSQISLTFPDGAKRAVSAGITGLEVAEVDLAKSLAKSTVAMSLDGKLADLAAPIKADAAIKFLTRDDPEALELIRHDAAHVMAEAVQELYPGTQVTIGPVIENGFYYDFAPRRDASRPTICPRSKPRCARSSRATRPSPAR